LVQCRDIIKIDQIYQGSLLHVFAWFDDDIVLFILMNFELAGTYVSFVNSNAVISCMKYDIEQVAVAAAALSVSIVSASQ
jgi:hypothetical protein